MSEQYQPEQATIDERPVEEQGVLSRIQGMAVNAWRSAIRHPRELLAIGAASFACAQAAELSVDAVPAGASTNKLEKKCRADILAEPTIDQAEMLHPGERNQYWSLQFGLNNVSKACDRRYRRVVSATFQLIRGKNAINMNGPLHGRYWGDAYWFDESTRNNRAGEGGLSDINSHNLKARYFRPGDEARYGVRLQEKDIKTDKILATRIFWGPIEVEK